MITGQRVYHVRYGRGEVLRIDRVRDGLTAEVKFPFAVLRVPVAELVDANSGRPLEAPSTAEDKPQEPGLTLDSTRREARQGITALRLGQILESQVLGLSVGLEKVTGAIESILKRATAGRPPRAQLVLVEGPWGTGKTHTLTLLQALARQSGLASCLVVLDGSDLTLRNPNRLYTAIFNGIRFPGSLIPQGIGDKLYEVKAAGHVSRLRHVGATRIADALEATSLAQLEDPDQRHIFEDYLAGDLSAAQATWMLGAIGQLPKIAAREIMGRPARFVSLLQEWARFMAAAGARGLVVMLDELDVEYAFFPSRWRERRTELLCELRSLGESDAPLVIALGSAPSGASIPTWGDPVQDILRSLDGVITHIRVPQPSREDLRRLFQKLVDLYATAYESPKLLEADALKPMCDDILESYRRNPAAVPRHMVRRSIEQLDILSSMLAGGA